MAYSTIDDILERIPERIVTQLTDDAKLGVIDVAKIEAAIARADQEINAWCGGRYLVPFDSVPGVISGLSADMAVYHLYARKAEKTPETRSDSYKNAVALLKEISRGNVSLGAAGIQENPPGGGAAIVSAPARQFSRNTLKGLF